MYGTIAVGICLFWKLKFEGNIPSDLLIFLSPNFLNILPLRQRNDRNLGFALFSGVHFDFFTNTLWPIHTLMRSTRYQLMVFALGMLFVTRGKAKVYFSSLE